MTATGNGRVLAPGLYGFDDLSVGDTVETGWADVTTEVIDGFANLSGDRFALHMDTDAARALGFPDRVAHGLLVLSLADGLKNQAPAQFRAVASLGWDIRFSAPVFAGDAIAARIRVDGMRPTRAGNRGILTLGFEVHTRDGRVVQSGTNNLMVEGAGAADGG